MKTNNIIERFDDQDSIISYKQLRLFIGILGFFLTFMLVVTVFLLQDTQVWKISISHYYYSFAHIIFVGTLCILGGLFLTYRGKNRWENRLSNLTGFFALCVAAFPTKYDGYDGTRYIQLDFYPDWFNYIHFGSAFLLFLGFAIYCLVFFQNMDNEIEMSNSDALRKKKNRNNYYKICGIGILLSIACIAFFNFVVTEKQFPNSCFIKFSTIIFETTALFFFSTSWLMKSSDLLWDKFPFLQYFR
ncbi:MAG: hypothetical protein JST62_04555 [Bacteroidetes bacterium]|jgi:hypothetical protein|nr:hypothetical protein [Bacteroidota bacterium]